MTRTAPASLWRHRDFMLMWSGQSVSEIGSGITMLALPLLALETLDISTFQFALLSAASSSAFLLVALQAGALVDRMRKKRVMVATDAMRALAIGSIPLAHAFDALTLAQLYVVALVTSVLTVFFDVAYQSYLPILVGKDQLVDGNGKIGASQAVAQLAGPGAGGPLVGWIGAANTMLLDAFSFAWSTAAVALVRDPEPKPERRPEGTRLRTEIAEGLRYVLHHPILKKVVGCTATSNFFSSMFGAIELLFLIRVLDASPGVAGAVVALGAVGGLVGAVLCNRLARKIGSARIIWVSLLVEAPFAFAAPLAFPGWGVLLISVSGFALGFAAVVYNVAQVSYRQAVTPPALLGRMNASTRFIVWGVMPLGALAGGALGQTIGIRETLFVAAAGSLLAPLWVIFSPLFGMRDVPEADEAPAHP